MFGIARNPVRFLGRGPRRAPSGRRIVNVAADRVGEIDSVVSDRIGKVRYAVVGVGGRLDIGLCFFSASRAAEKQADKESGDNEGSGVA